MQYKSTPSGTHILDCPELANLSRNIDGFFRSAPTVNSTSLFQAITDYIIFVKTYINTELKGKIIELDNLAPNLFNVNILKNNTYKQFVRCNLYALYVYVNDLQQSLDINFIDRYKCLLLSLCCESEFAIVEYEKNYKKAPETLTYTHGRRPVLSTTDLIFSMSELFWIENSDFSKFDYRDIKPNTIFVIRQFLEMFWKNVIGYEGIVDATNGASIKKFTQAAWSFIEEYKDKTGIFWNLDLPVNKKTISVVNNWANSFVHDTFIYDTHIQYMAILICRELMKAPSSSVACFIDNEKPQRKTSALHGCIYINNYSALRVDFEHDIKQKMPNAKIIWKDLNNVGAYIITMGDYKKPSVNFEFERIRKYICDSCKNLYKGIRLLFNHIYKVVMKKY